MMSLSNVLYGDRLVTSVFAQFAPDSKFKVFDAGEIVAAFAKAKESGKYPNLLSSIAFDKDGIEARSPLIEDSINSLQQARLIGRFNPDLREYRITKAVRIRFEKYIKPELQESDLIEIKRLSDDLKETLGIVDTK